MNFFELKDYNAKHLLKSISQLRLKCRPCL